MTHEGGTGAVLLDNEEAGHLPISERSVSPFAIMLRRRIQKGNPA
jgi:hypothetical protein